MGAAFWLSYAEFWEVVSVESGEWSLGTESNLWLCGGSRLGSPCLQGELDFVAASRQQKTERIFVLPTLGILTAFI